MDNKDELTYTLKDDIQGIEFDISQLNDFCNKVKNITDNISDKGKTRGGLLNNVDVNKANVLNTDLNKFVDEIKRKVNKVNNSDISSLDDNTVRTYQKALKRFETYLRDVNRVQNNVDQINQYDTGRLTKNNYSRTLNTDLNNYSNTYNSIYTKYKTINSVVNSVIRRSLNAIDKDEVTFTFDDKLKNDYNNIVDNDLIGGTKDILDAYTNSLDVEKERLKKEILSDRKKLKGYHDSADISKYRKNIAENKKRLHDINAYTKKTVEMYNDLVSIEYDLKKAYEDYGNSDTYVAPSKYSFMGNLRRIQNRVLGSAALTAITAVTGSMYQGNSLRVNNFNNGIGATMYQLYSSGDKKLDNKIQKYVDKLGINNGTHMKGSDVTQLLGAYISSNRTGNVSDYKEQINVSSSFSAHTGVSVDNTAELISSLGFSGVTNQKDVLKNIYGSLVNSNMLSRGNEQVSSLSMMFSNLANIGNLTTTQANNMTNFQQLMANTKNSALQGQQGANAYIAYANTLTNTKNNVMRNIGAETFGIKLGKSPDSYFKLQLKMEQARKDPKMLSKLVKNMVNYYGDEKATANYLAKYSGGSLTTTQAYKLVELSESGKLTKKELNKITKDNKKESPLKKNLDKALKGSGNFNINLYLAVNEKTDNNSSMAFDGVRNLNNQVFKNHPILKGIFDVGGSVLVSTVSGVAGSFISSKLSGIFKFGASKAVSKATSKVVSSTVSSAAKGSISGLVKGKGAKLLGTTALLGTALSVANKENKNTKETETQISDKENSKHIKHSTHHKHISHKSSISDEKLKENKEDNLLDLEYAYFHRGIEIVNRAFTISNIINTNGDSSSSGDSGSSDNDDKDSKDKKDDKKKDKKESKKDDKKKNKKKGSKKDSKKEDKKESKKKKSKPSHKAKKLARGGFISDYGVDFYNIDDLRSDTGYDSTIQTYDRKESDLRELNAKYDTNHGSIDREIIKNVRPKYNVNLSIANKDNYNHYVSLINNVLSDFTNSIANML